MSATVNTWAESWRARPQDGWLDGRRADALEAFASRGWPTARDEDWKHTPLRRLGEQAWRPEPASLSLPAGATSFSAAVAAHPERIAESIGHAAPHAVASLNLAFFSEGAFIDLPAGERPEAPFLITHRASGEEGAAVQTRHLIRLAEGAEATVFERWEGAPGRRLHTHVTHVHLARGAKLRWFKISEEGAETTHLATVEATLNADATLEAAILSAGGQVGRTELRVRLQGEGASARLSGVALAGAGQHQDLLTHVDHAAKQGTSDQHFRAIVHDGGSSVFNGLVLVRQGADGADAQQLSRSLLLGDDAEAHTRPQLEIHADDVKCKHGATVGSLDPEALNFLRSRGIGLEEARALLIGAFLSEWVAELPEAARPLAEACVGRWEAP
jgi:Fe-S cluster assembly protein SufD